MKYIILLLLTLSSFAQTKVIAYRLINEHEDGPCSVKTYVEYDYSEGFLTYVTAESSNEILANKLRTIKKESKKWKSVSFNCEDNMIGGEMIHNMFVIENKGKTDTIFATKGNEYVVFPEERKAYTDTKQELNNSLTGIIKEFSEHDFDKDLSGMFMGRRDSISSGKVLYKGKNLYGYTRDRFEKEFANLEFISEKTKYEILETVYKFENNIYTFYDDVIDSIEILKAGTGWQFDGQTIGNAEIAYEEKYPLSMSFNVIHSVKFEDLQKENLHWLDLINQKGSISFWIKEGKLDRFAVYYSYPKN